jgi:hypothetical protein
MTAARASRFWLLALSFTEKEPGLEGVRAALGQIPEPLREAALSELKRVVPRGGLRQVNLLNDLVKSETLFLLTLSLCFLARVSHLHCP